MKLYLQPPAKMVVEIDGIRGYLDTVEEVTYINLKNTLFGLGFTRLDHGYTVINWERVRFIMGKIEHALGVLDSNVKLSKRDFIHEEVFRMLADQSNTADARTFKATVCNLIVNKAFALYKEQPRNDEPDTESNKLTVIEVEGVHGYLDEDGTAWLNVEDVARGLGFVDYRSRENREAFATCCESSPKTPIFIRWGTINSYLAEFGYPPVKRGDFIPENIFYLLAMKASNETAKTFQLKVANEILPAIRKHGFYVADNVKVEQDQSPISDFERGQALTQLAKAARDNDIRRKIVMEAANLLAGKQIF